MNANCVACVASEVGEVANCWSCGVTKKSAYDLFCRNCSSIQPPVKSSFFDLLGVSPPDFDIDVKKVEARYKNLMRKLHPDKYMQQCARQRDFSSVGCQTFSTQRSARPLNSSPLFPQAQSAAVNVAYCTLKCPYARAVYMLREFGWKFEEEDNSTADAEFMMKVQLPLAAAPRRRPPIKLGERASRQV